MSLRFKIFLTSLLSALIVASGSVWLFSNSWVDLARGYGLLNIQSRLDSLSTGSSKFKEGEWALTLDLYSETSKAKNIRWQQKPFDLDKPALRAFRTSLISSISKTNLNEGSFEINLANSKGESIPFFVVFKNAGDLNNPNRVLIAGSQDQLALKRLSPLAAPFILFVVVALILAAVFSIIFSNVLNKSYTTLERTLEDITAGRLEKLSLPESKDVSVLKISRAIKKLVEILETKEQQLGKVSAMAHEDPMTNIPNFRAFTDYVERNLPTIKSLKGSVTVLVIIDLDFFKKVNDNHGHQVGDFVLIESAKAISSGIRTPDNKSDRVYDFCARYGGEEFVAIYNNVDPDLVENGPLRILHAIRDMPLNIPAEISNNKKPFSMNVTCSLGMAVWDSSRHTDKDSWIKEADEALYAAKEGGRARLAAIYPEAKDWQ